MQPVKWFHRGTAPMIAIYPDDIDGTNPLRPMSAGAGLRPVHWTHNGSAPQKAIYPNDVDGTLRPLLHGAGEMPVEWRHRGTAALVVNFNEVLVVSGGGDEYTTGAVNFDQLDTAITCASLSCADSPVLSFSVFYRVVNNVSLSLFRGDPGGNDGNFGKLTPPAGWHFSFINSDYSNAVEVRTGVNENDAQWHHIVASVKSDLAQGEKIVKIYRDDVAVIDPAFDPPLDFAGAFDIVLNGFEFSLGYGTAGAAVIELADFWFAGQSLLTGSDITEATRRKFISAEGKPVNLGADGSTPTGTAPVVFFRRAPEAAASTFANNLGTGGAFTITGTLTNAGTSPSD